MGLAKVVLPDSVAACLHVRLDLWKSEVIELLMNYFFFLFLVLPNFFIILFLFLVLPSFFSIYNTFKR
jgi:hypothetical protein